MWSGVEVMCGISYGVWDGELIISGALDVVHTHTRTRTLKTNDTFKPNKTSRLRNAHLFNQRINMKSVNV